MIKRQPVQRATILGILAVSATAVLAPGAQASGGEIGGFGNTYYLSDSFAGRANIVYDYGISSDQVFVGDWDGNGTDTLALRRAATFRIRNTHTSGNADVAIVYGNSGDTVLVGDWDGDGTDTLAVRRGSQYFFKNSITSGVADTVVTYGDPGDAILVGDWNGDGIDTLAVHRGATFFIKDSITTGVADTVVTYGDPGDAILVGDWNGDGADTLAVRRAATYYLKDSISTGTADRIVPYGEPTDTTLVGDWNGDRTDTLGVRRPFAPVAPPAPAITFGDGTYVGANVPLGTYRAQGSSTCYWERRSGLGGTFSEIAGSDYGSFLPIVTINTSDASFYTIGCGTWTPVGATYPAVPAVSMPDGWFMVGAHIAPGTYSAPGSVDCRWGRRSAFLGSHAGSLEAAQEYLGAGGIPGAQTANILPSDLGFTSRNCGTWSKIG